MASLHTFQNYVAPMQKIIVVELAATLQEKELMNEELEDVFKGVLKELDENCSTPKKSLRNKKTSKKKGHSNTIKSNLDYIRAYFNYDKTISSTYYKKTAEIMKSLRKNELDISSDKAMRKAIEIINEQENKIIFTVNCMNKLQNNTGSSSSLNTLSDAEMGC